MDTNPQNVTRGGHAAPEKLLAVLGCALAIAAHTAGLVFLRVEPSATWLISLTYFYAAKAAVPALLMTLGYVSLGRQDSYAHAFGRFLRTGICLLLFTGIWYLARVLAASSGSISLRALAKAVLQTPVSAYRPVYVYMGILLMLPFLQKLAAAMEKKDFHVFFLVSGGICGLWPVVGHYLPRLAFSAEELLPLFGGCIAMVFAGDYARRYFVTSRKWRAAALAAFATLCLVNVGLTYGEYLRTGGEDYLFFENVTYLPVMAEGVCLLYVMSTAKPGKGIQKCAELLSPLTFGIYMTAGIAAPGLQTGFYFLVSRGLHPLLSLLVFQIFVFVLAVGLSWLLSKLPFINRRK